jgi:hypothetical protein
MANLKIDQATDEMIHDRGQFRYCDTSRYGSARTVNSRLPPKRADYYQYYPLPGLILPCLPAERGRIIQGDGTYLTEVPPYSLVA